MQSPMPDGGESVVYRAVNLDTLRPVVFVVLPPLDADARASFEGWASQVVTLRHPGIAPVLSYGSEGDRVYVVSELIEGTSLGALLSSGGLGGILPMAVLRQVAAAVDFIHTAGVVHGDLSADTVVINREGRAILTGLGNAWLLGKASGQVMAPTGYSAPEQARTGVPTPAADRYSFAALASVLVQKPAAQTGSDGAISRILVRGLSEDPGARWPSCMAMVEALDAALAPPPAAAPTRRRTGLWIAAALGAIVIIFGIIVVLSRQPSAPSTPAATLSLSRNTVQAGATMVVSGANLPANQAGSVQLESQPQQLGTFTADSAGSFTLTVTIPEQTSQGDHTMAVCWNNSCPLKQTLTVAAAPTPSPTPSPSPSPTATSSASPSGTATTSTATPSPS